ncbi:MAG: leucine-rich repeat protein [Muribaculaceae bacterium]|nr:leucine-rich repeat protein [Muribaculaceae bacterium]
MKHLLKLLLLLMALLMPAISAAHDFEVDGIYYNRTSSSTVEVTYKNVNDYSYSGEVVIPSVVTYNSVDYTVTAIGDSAFFGSDIRKVTIPESVTCIGLRAFVDCDRLDVVTCLPIVPPSMNESFDSHIACPPFFVVDPDFNDEFDDHLLLYVSSMAYESYKNQNEQYNYFSYILGYDWEKTAPPTVEEDFDYSFDRLVGCSVELTPSEDCEIYYDVSIYSSSGPWWGNSWMLWCQNELYISAIYICIPTHFSFKACAIAEGKLPSDLVYATDDEGIWPSYVASFDFYDAGVYYSYVNDNEVCVTFGGYYDPCGGEKNRLRYDYMVYHEYYSDDLVIPSHIGDYTVTRIGQDACADCVNLNSITIPATIYSIDYAFDYCPNLTAIICLGTQPPMCEEQGMGFSGENYQNVTLYVPQSAIDAYRNAPIWCNFQNIVGVNDDNYLSMEDVEAFRGDTIVVPVALTNEADIISFQTDIFLPDGLELLQEDGEYIIDPSDRMTRTHSIVSNDVSNGAVRVLCYSSNYKPFTGESGDDLFYLTVKVADDAEGDYAIQLKNTLLTTSDFEELVAPDVSGTVHVKSYMPGDANGSGTVTVTDVVVASQYVLEMNPHPFIFEAADVNFDGTITVTDVSRIAWIVLNPTLSAPMRASALLNNGDRMSGESVIILPGETRKVSIALDNKMDYTAFQLDLNLPEGLSASNFAVTDRAVNHAFDVSMLADGNTRALCYSPTLKGLGGHEGALLTFDVTAAGLVEGDITVDGIELVTVDCQTVKLDTFTIGVNNSSAINEVTNGKAVAHVDYFNLAGQQLTEPVEGVTLIVTTYTDGTRVATKVFR